MLDGREKKSPDAESAAVAASRASSSAGASSSASTNPESGSEPGCCPFCGHVRAETVGPCARCTMEDSPATRMATAQRVGPWFVLQRKNPTAPGLKHAVLLSLVRRGLITPESIVRGPTTQQLWRRASHTRGIAREFGVCWSCQASVNSEVSTCSRCGSPQSPPEDPDVFLDGPNTPVMREITGDIDSGIESNSEGINDGFESPRQVMQVPPAARKQRPRASRAQLDPARSPEPIMSAKELAAVFQLQPSGLPTRSRSRRFFRSLITTSAAILLVTCTATAALLYAKPEWRAIVQDHATRYWNQLRTPNAPGSVSADSSGTNEAASSADTRSGDTPRANGSSSADRSEVPARRASSDPASGTPISPSLADVGRSGGITSSLTPASSANSPDRSPDRSSARSTGGSSERSVDSGDADSNPASNQVGRDSSMKEGPANAANPTPDAVAKATPTPATPASAEATQAGAPHGPESVAPAGSVNAATESANPVPGKSASDAAPVSGDTSSAPTGTVSASANASSASTDQGPASTDAAQASADANRPREVPRDVPVVPEGLDIEPAREVLRDLHVRAAAFERDGDFLRAIACYEQMRRLPEEVRPTHIDTQIARLKRRAGVPE